MPARRCGFAALMGTGAVYVMTHDSIGLGEDGPTHQPVEHLAALRAHSQHARVPHPATRSRFAECWELALNRNTGPTVLALTRQNLPQTAQLGARGQSLQPWRLRAGRSGR